MMCIHCIYRNLASKLEAGSKVKGDTAASSSVSLLMMSLEIM